MSSLIFIDPGKHKVARAYFLAEMLSGVDYCHVSALPDLQADRVLYELPQQRGRFSNVRVSDLILLAAIGGQAAGKLGQPVTVSTWKGSRSKATMHSRMLEKTLTQGEVTLLGFFLERVPRREHHNVLDAVCGGLVMLGRM